MTGTSGQRLRNGGKIQSKAWKSSSLNISIFTSLWALGCCCFLLPPRLPFLPVPGVTWTDPSAFFFFTFFVFGNLLSFFHFMRRFWNLNNGTKESIRLIRLKAWWLAALPYFYLTLREHQCVSDFDSSAPCQIAIIVKFLLELQYLMTGVGRTLTLGDVVHCILTAHWARFEFFLGGKRKLKRIRNQFNLLRRWRGNKLYAKVEVINLLSCHLEFTIERKIRTQREKSSNELLRRWKMVKNYLKERRPRWSICQAAFQTTSPGRRNSGSLNGKQRKHISLHSVQSD